MDHQDKQGCPSSDPVQENPFYQGQDAKMNSIEETAQDNQNYCLDDEIFSSVTPA